MNYLVHVGLVGRQVRSPHHASLAVRLEALMTPGGKFATAGNTFLVDPEIRRRLAANRRDRSRKMGDAGEPTFQSEYVGFRPFRVGLQEVSCGEEFRELAGPLVNEVHWGRTLLIDTQLHAAFGRGQ